MNCLIYSYPDMERWGLSRDCTHGVRAQTPIHCPCLLLPPPGLKQKTHLSTDYGDGGGSAVGLHAWDFEPNDVLILGLQATMLETGPVDTVRSTEACAVQGQDGVIVTALHQGVVHLVSTFGCWLAKQ